MIGLKLVNDVTSGESREHPANPGKSLGPWLYDLLLGVPSYGDTCGEKNGICLFLFSRRFIGSRSLNGLRYRLGCPEAEAPVGRRALACFPVVAACNIPGISSTVSQLVL